MVIRCLALVFCALLAARINVIKASGEEKRFSVAFQWNFINYTWESQAALAHAESFGHYVPGEDVIAGIKIYKDVIYLALPRVKKSARVTLASLPLSGSPDNPLLAPFPSWAMNSGAGCDTLQDVLSMEVDPQGVMWVLDARRVDNVTSCPPRIILLDLEAGGSVLHSFEVPDELCPHARGCFLNDIVVDGDLAYMSDTTRADPGIFVYSRKLDRAWKVRDPSMFGDAAAERFVTQGITKQGVENINGVALSPNCGGNRTFYFMPQSSFHIFSIDTFILQDPTLAAGSVGAYITDHGRKQGQSGGMMCDERGDIYYGLLPLDAVGKWDTSKPLGEAAIVEQNSEIIKWPDSFAFDGKGNLFLITNSILYFSKRKIDVGEVNFRIIKLLTGTRSYFYCSEN